MYPPFLSVPLCSMSVALFRLPCVLLHFTHTYQRCLGIACRGSYTLSFIEHITNLVRNPLDRRISLYTLFVNCFPFSQAMSERSTIISIERWCTRSQISSPSSPTGTPQPASVARQNPTTFGIHVCYQLRTFTLPKAGVHKESDGACEHYGKYKFAPTLSTTRPR